MTDVSKSGAALMDEVQSTDRPEPALWWLGQCGFIVKSYDMTFYVDPCLSSVNGRKRAHAAPLEPARITNADLILCTHPGPSHMDPGTLRAMLGASPRARVVIPKSAAEHAYGLGIPYSRMTTTDSDLRVEYFKRGVYGRVYSVPSAHPELDWTPLGGFPHLGYLLRFGSQTIYHAGDCCWYEGIVDRLRPYRVTAALLPINGDGNFEAHQAAQLAEDIGASWLIPMHYGMFGDGAPALGRFIDHMLGFRPALRFKVFQVGEKWVLPGEAD